ncbi:MAG: hypothetical protein DRN95_04550 [Candidatus Hydrothermarchaeota archaeon]|nr:MAG: hypothetical protein DRN95_04550 [Candidatus Hydrothermarchaeota archaeon]
MLYKPTVIFFMTSYCNFCKRFKRAVLRSYILRNEIHYIEVNVEIKPAIEEIRDENVNVIREQETCFHQEYLWAGDRTTEGHSVPCVKIIPPYGNPEGYDEGKFIFSEGDEREFFAKVKKELDKWIRRKGIVI